MFAMLRTRFFFWAKVVDLRSFMKQREGKEAILALKCAVASPANSKRRSSPAAEQKWGQGPLCRKGLTFAAVLFDPSEAGAAPPKGQCSSCPPGGEGVLSLKEFRPPFRGQRPPFLRSHDLLPF